MTIEGMSLLLGGGANKHDSVKLPYLKLYSASAVPMERSFDRVALDPDCNCICSGLNLPQNKLAQLSGEKANSGAIFLELVLTLPLLVVLLIVAFEFGNLLQLKQGITFIARESASYAFRECSPYQDVTARQACLDYVQGRMQQLALTATGNGNVDVLIAVFQRTPTGLGNPTRIAVSPPGGVFTNTGGISRIQRHLNVSGEGRTRILAMANQFDRIVAAEVQIRYQPILLRDVRLGNVVFDLPNNLFFYETAVF